MGLVDKQVVDARLLECDARVAGRVELGLELLLAAGDRFSIRFTVRPRSPFARSSMLAQLPDLLALVGGLGVGGDRQAAERGAGHDHRVPVVRRDPRDELPAPIAGEILAGGGQHPGLRVDLQPLAAELLQHVVRNHDGRLATQARAGAARIAPITIVGRLAGADLVKQADGRLGDDPRDRGALMRPRRERAGDAGQRQLLAGGAVVAQHEAVEPRRCTRGSAAPRARGPPSTTRANRSCSASAFSWAAAVSVAFSTRLVRSPTSISSVTRIGPLLHHRLGDLKRVHPAGAPLAGGLDRVGAALDRPDRRAGMLHLDAGILEQLCEELPVGVGVDPRRPQPRRDLLRTEVRRQHPLERGDVDLRATCRLRPPRGPARA